MSDELPEFLRLHDGRVGWFERALSPVEQLKELAELDDALRRIGPKG
jgi:hypothetical protein